MNWIDVSKKQARERILNGQSQLVLGLAGTGKSHFIRECVKELEANGKRVAVIAKTHNAAAVAGGDTADHLGVEECTRRQYRHRHNLGGRDLNAQHRATPRHQSRQSSPHPDTMDP